MITFYAVVISRAETQMRRDRLPSAISLRNASAQSFFWETSS